MVVTKGPIWSVRVALVMADGIPVPRGRYMLRMGLVHAHVPDIVIICVKDRDFVFLLQHLHTDVPKHEGNAARPTPVAGRRIGNFFLGNFAVLFHHLGRLGFQDRVGEVAHQLGKVTHTIGTCPVCSRSIIGI